MNKIDVRWKELLPGTVRWWRRIVFGVAWTFGRPYRRFSSPVARWQSRQRVLPLCFEREFPLLPIVISSPQSGQVSLVGGVFDATLDASIDSSDALDAFCSSRLTSRLSRAFSWLWSWVSWGFIYVSLWVWEWTLLTWLGALALGMVMLWRRWVQLVSQSWNMNDFERSRRACQSRQWYPREKRRPAYSDISAPPPIRGGGWGQAGTEQSRVFDRFFRHFIWRNFTWNSGHRYKMHILAVW